MEQNDYRKEKKRKLEEELYNFYLKVISNNRRTLFVSSYIRIYLLAQIEFQV